MAEAEIRGIQIQSISLYHYPLVALRVFSLRLEQTLAMFISGFDIS